MKTETLFDFGTLLSNYQYGFQDKQLDRLPWVLVIGNVAALKQVQLNNKSFVHYELGETQFQGQFTIFKDHLAQYFCIHFETLCQAERIQELLNILRAYRHVLQFRSLWLLTDGGEENHWSVYQTILHLIETRLKPMPRYLFLPVETPKVTLNHPLLLEFYKKQQGEKGFEQSYTAFIASVLSAFRGKNYELESEQEAYQIALTLEQQRTFLNKMDTLSARTMNMIFQGVAFWYKDLSANNNKLIEHLLIKQYQAVHRVKALQQKRNRRLLWGIIMSLMCAALWTTAYHDSMNELKKLNALTLLLDPYKTHSLTMEINTLHGMVNQGLISHFGMYVGDYYAHALEVHYRQLLQAQQKELQIKHVEHYFDAKLAKNYPFNDQSEREIPIAQLIAFFGSNGSLDQLTNGLPETVMEHDLKLQQLLHIKAQVQKLFNQNAPQLTLSLLPIDADSRVTQVTLTINQQAVVFQHDPQVPSVVNWHFEATNHVNLTLRDSNDQTYTEDFYGSWALFKFLDTCRQDQQDQQAWNCKLGGYYVTYKLTDSVGNAWHDPF